VAIGVLAGLPTVVFGLPALAGYPVMPGDDHDQNYPLRVLAGAQLRHGHLPLFDPYIWGGAPLLGGWNAAAAYPPTLLFAVLPAVAAWTANLIITWWTAGLGTYAFLRACRLSPLAGVLAALSFGFAGAMTAQVTHFGLVAGMSWVPVALLALLRLAGAAQVRSRLAWVAVLAAASGLIVLAGEPRAIDDAVVIIACYAGWRAFRLGTGREPGQRAAAPDAGGAAGALAGRRCRGPRLPGRWRRSTGYLALVLAGVALGGALGAVQLLPGIAVLATSQRAAHSLALFDSGSLSPNRLLLSLVPDVLGGSGSFGQPPFLGTYSLNEMTGYVGLMPLAAACALPAARWRAGRGRAGLAGTAAPAGVLPEWAVWHLVAIIGVVLALGGNTPLGPWLARLPLYGGQRLQSRNLVVADLALAVLLGYWADRWLGEQQGQPSRAGRLAAALPGAAGAALAALAMAWGAGMLRWLGLASAKAAQAGALRPGLVPFLVLGLLAVALAWWGPRLAPGARARALAGFVVADICAFTLLAVVAVAPAGGGPAPALAAPARGTPGRVKPIGIFTHGGRFAIYDPGLLDRDALPALGAPDSNILSGTPAVEGYSSLVDAAYARATGSHQAAGEGQDVLALAAIGNGTLDQLDTTVLATPPAYLLTPVTAGEQIPDKAGARERAAGVSGGAAPVPAPGSTGPVPCPGGGAGPGLTPGGTGPGFRHLLPGQPATWYFGSRLAVASVTIPVCDRSRGPGPRIGLILPSGSLAWAVTDPVRPGQVSARRARPLAAVGIRVVARSGTARLGPPVISTATGARYRAAGQLQGVLVPPRWRFVGSDGPFALFGDSLARSPLTLRALPGAPASGAWVRSAGGPGFAPASARVFSPHGVSVIRSVADIPGWTASWRPAGGKTAMVLPVHRSGLVQSVTVPAGSGTLSWRYDPPGALPGAWISLSALAALLSVSLAAACQRRAVA
jgi:hypothetical protein